MAAVTLQSTKPTMGAELPGPGEAAAPRCDTWPLLHIHISGLNDSFSSLLPSLRKEATMQMIFPGLCLSLPLPTSRVAAEQSLNSEVTVEMWWPGASPAPAAAPAADLMVPGMLYSHS